METIAEILKAYSFSGFFLKKKNILGIKSKASDWLNSHLKSNSSWRQNMCEMQQGSMLGPLLSLIFINDYSSASKSFEMFFFCRR